MAATINITMNEDDSTLETLTIGNVWRIVRTQLVNVGYLHKHDNECPVAYITNRNYFDIFNVFVSVDRATTGMTRAEALRLRYKWKYIPENFRYWCKLQDIIKFPEDKLEAARKWTTVVQDNAKRTEDISLHLKSGPPKSLWYYGPYVYKEIQAEISGLRKFTTIPNWWKTTSARLDRKYPDETKRKIKIISEVVVADKVKLAASYTYPCTKYEDEKTETNEWTLEGPVIIAFGAIDLILDYSDSDSDSEQQLIEIIDEERSDYYCLTDRKLWVYKLAPIRCNIINKLYQGGHYDLTRPLRRDKYNPKITDMLTSRMYEHEIDIDADAPPRLRRKYKIRKR